MGEYIDADGNGTSEYWAEDTNGDGQYDLWYLDGDGNGYFEQILHDNNGDLVVDWSENDADQNGTIETWGIDGNRDGVADSYAWDTSGDGAADIFGVDANEDGVIETVAFDLNQNGIEDRSETATTYATIGPSTIQDPVSVAVQPAYNPLDSVMSTVQNTADPLTRAYQYGILAKINSDINATKEPW